MRTLTFALIALFATFCLAGCGQSGPLYLPGNPSTVQEPIEQPADENNDDDEDDEDGPRKQP